MTAKFFYIAGGAVAAASGMWPVIDSYIVAGLVMGTGIMLSSILLSMGDKAAEREREAIGS